MTAPPDTVVDRTTHTDTAVDHTDPLAVTAAILEHRTRIKVLDENIAQLQTEQRELMEATEDLGTVLDVLLDRPREYY